MPEDRSVAKIKDVDELMGTGRDIDKDLVHQSHLIHNICDVLLRNSHSISPSDLEKHVRMIQGCASKIEDLVRGG